VLISFHAEIQGGFSSVPTSLVYFPVQK
jgi:hypothetical protein